MLHLKHSLQQTNFEFNNQYSQRADYTFKYNRNLGRHGWLRLTPAYSVKLVKDILNETDKKSVILDPFSGTATTGLVAAEHGNQAFGFDINPFLIWLGNIKCRNYTNEYLDLVIDKSSRAIMNCHQRLQNDNWIPSLYNIHRWWSPHTLQILSALRACLVDEFGEPKDNEEGGLAWVAFCRLVIETSSAAFNHVSMSFSEFVEDYELTYIINFYIEILKQIILSCKSQVLGQASIIHTNSTDIPELALSVDVVITSPPYPNRISYVRELRPYMYWTKFLADTKDAGELDWQAVGGTWGAATSRLAEWKPNLINLPASLYDTVKNIQVLEEKNSTLLASYVFKYFHDMYGHLDSLKKILNDGARLNYIVGNSTFYGVRVDTERIFMDCLKLLDYKKTNAEIIRKRNCNKALYEYLITARYE